MADRHQQGTEPRRFGAAFAQLLHAEWIRFRSSRARVVGMGAAAMLTLLLGLAYATGMRFSGPEGVTHALPVGPDGEAVTDQFFFLHQSLTGNGSLTARVRSLTGIITYPPPNHDQIVSGVVPWAKAGVIVKESTQPGSAYAAVMVTGHRGVRLQYNFTGDISGQLGGATVDYPRWLKLTRSGDTLTGYASSDGTQWTEVATAQLPGLPVTVQAGLFVTSPGDVTVAQGASRFTQATATFDHVSFEGTVPGAWSREYVGAAGPKTDWERFHRAAGVEESGGIFTVSGSGDIAPGADGPTIGFTLLGTFAGLIVVVLIAVRFAIAGRRSVDPASPSPGWTLTAKAVIIGTVALLAGLAAAFGAVSVGKQILLAHRVPIIPVSSFTILRLVAGVGALFAANAVLALAIGSLCRRTFPAMTVALAVIGLPYILALTSMVPEPASQWLLRLTPAAGFALLQSVPAYPQVIGMYTPIMGYYPLTPLAGFAVLCAYAAITLGLAVILSPAPRTAPALAPSGSNR